MSPKESRNNKSGGIRNALRMPPLISYRDEPTVKLRSCADCCRFRRGDDFILAVGLCLAGLAGLAAFADVDAALEVRAVFNGDAGCDYVAGERAVAADIYAIAGGEVASHF